MDRSAWADMDGGDMDEASGPEHYDSTIGAEVGDENVAEYAVDGSRDIDARIRAGEECCREDRAACAQDTLGSQAARCSSWQERRRTRR